MSTIEQFFVDHQFSYTSSKVIPFVLMLGIGLIIGLLVKNWMKKSWLKISVLLSCLLLPLMVYLGFYPIYENDFSAHPKQVIWPKELNYLPDSSIVVVTIPNCPYCEASVAMSNRMLERNPNLEITYIVLAYRVEDMVKYKKQANARIAFRIANDHQLYLKFTKGSFPFYLKRQKSKGLIWSNNEMGPVAMDELEN
ncbi:MAG: hypothetical protein IT221_03770 [Fluviicola sp.]|nr:hypothetical protein [Fluviicola sp.]